MLFAENPGFIHKLGEDNFYYRNSVGDRGLYRTPIKSMVKLAHGFQSRETNSLGLLGLPLAQACMSQAEVGRVCQGILLALSEESILSKRYELHSPCYSSLKAASLPAYYGINFHE